MLCIPNSEHREFKRKNKTNVGIAVFRLWPPKTIKLINQKLQTHNLKSSHYKLQESTKQDTHSNINRNKQCKKKKEKCFLLEA